MSDKAKKKFRKVVQIQDFARRNLEWVAERLGNAKKMSYDSGSTGWSRKDYAGTAFRL